MKQPPQRNVVRKSCSPRRTPSARVLDRLATAMSPIRNEGLTEHVIRELKRCILQRLIRPGERLPPERQLATLFDISRGSLRQGLKALQVMGVLEIIHGSGTYLSENSEAILRDPESLLVPLRGHSFAEMYEARRAMEAESAATASVRAERDDIINMRREIRAMRSATRNIQRFVQHDRAFHRHIALASGNSVFVWFIDLLQNILAEGQVSHARTEQLADVIAEHERIVAAIEAGRSDLARSEMLAHLTLSKAYTDQDTGVELRVVSQAR
jgi:GntR family transcriptional regulator, transcriptional repressor for pyruvate dehydrogenase complex